MKRSTPECNCSIKKNTLY